LDFGLAKLLPQPNHLTSDTWTDTQAGAGTLPYMPPEQLQGESVDSRADIRTIGAVLYEMATDRRRSQKNRRRASLMPFSTTRLFLRGRLIPAFRRNLHQTVKYLRRAC